MSTHPYLRAYMAGITVPTMFLLVGLTGFLIARYVYDVPLPIERVIMFPMAIVPNLWGLWNILYVALRPRWPLDIGLHGSLLPLILGPLGFGLTRLLDFHFPPTGGTMVAVLPIALALYYLAWKYLVGFFNEMLGIA